MIPEPEIFYLEFGLFNPIKFDTKEQVKAYDVLFYKGTVDSYCPNCKKDSVLESVDNYPRVTYNQAGAKLSSPTPMTSGAHFRIEYYKTTNFILKEFKCSRCSQIHQFHFEVKPSEDEESSYIIKKVGQCYSIADYQNHDIKKYRKVLGDNLYNEFSKGVGLFSHGVGIGSFVYLRRILEQFVIQEAYQNEKTKEGFKEEEYQKARVKDKIDLLKNSIPEFPVNNKTLYSILSKGIHELSEEECLDIFPVLKTAIEYILDEIKAKKELEEKKRILSEQIGKINSNIGSEK